MKCRSLLVLGLCAGLTMIAAAAERQGAKAPARAPAKAGGKKAPPPLPAASPEQLEAAQLVFYGRHDCEFSQRVDVVANAANDGYVDVRQGARSYLMKPVRSQTGALRLEDVKGETLWVQIPAKSMLMNVKAGRRLVDGCVSDRQREWIHETAKAQALAEAAAAEAARSASAPAAASAASDAASR